jgi:hypothetical protein
LYRQRRQPGFAEKLQAARLTKMNHIQGGSPAENHYLYSSKTTISRLKKVDLATIYATKVMPRVESAIAPESLTNTELRKHIQQQVCNFLRNSIAAESDWVPLAQARWHHR